MDFGTLVRPNKKELNLNLDYDLQSARRLKRGLGVNKRQKNSATNTWPVIMFDNRPCHGFDAILTSRQTREKLQCLYENLMSNNFRKTAVLKKISIVN